MEIASRFAGSKVKDEDKDQRTAAEPAETSIQSGMVPSLLTFQMWTAKVSA